MLSSCNLGESFYESVAQVNLYGVVRVTEAFLPLLKAAPHASIVNVSSALGSINFWLGDPPAFVRGGKAIPYWYNIVLSSFESLW